MTASGHMTPHPAAARFALGCVAVTVAWAAVGLAIAGCSDPLPEPGNDGQVCEQQNAADCPSDAGGEEMP